MRYGIGVTINETWRAQYRGLKGRFGSNVRNFFSFIFSSCMYQTSGLLSVVLNKCNAYCVILSMQMAWHFYIQTVLNPVVIDGPCSMDSRFQFIAICGVVRIYSDGLSLDAEVRLVQIMFSSHPTLVCHFPLWLLIRFQLDTMDNAAIAKHMSYRNPCNEKLRYFCRRFKASLTVLPMRAWI